MAAVYKKVAFERNGVRRGILCDGSQGPSALVAVYNILAIRHTTAYGDEGPVGEEAVKALIRGTLRTVLRRLASSVVQTLERQVSSAIDRLPATGIDVVCPLLGGVRHFEPTNSFMLFGYLGIELMHGWAADPEAGVYASIRSCSPAKLAEHCALLEGLDDELETDNLAVLHGLLNASGYQLTAYGFACLRKEIDEGGFTVVLCRNRFSVVHKHDGELFTLETDAEVRSRFPQATWRLFEEVEGDCIYLTEQFTPVKGQPNIAKARKWIEEKLEKKRNALESNGASSNVGPPTPHGTDGASSNEEANKPLTKGQRRKLQRRVAKTKSQEETHVAAASLGTDNASTSSAKEKKRTSK